MAADLPGSRLVFFPNCGHIPPIEAPEAFMRELTAFAALFVAFLHYRSGGFMAERFRKLPGTALTLLGAPFRIIEAASWEPGAGLDALRVLRQNFPTSTFLGGAGIGPRELDLGPACEQCGGMMQRTGSCYTCSSCGNNTGCG